MMYTSLVKRNCTSAGQDKDLACWPDNLFARTLIYLLPFCLIALVSSLCLVFLTCLHSPANYEGKGIGRLYVKRLQNATEAKYG